MCVCVQFYKHTHTNEIERKLFKKRNTQKRSDGDIERMLFREGREGGERKNRVERGKYLGRR